MTTAGSGEQIQDFEDVSPEAAQDAAGRHQQQRPRGYLALHQHHQRSPVRSPPAHRKDPPRTGQGGRGPAPRGSPGGSQSALRRSASRDAWQDLREALATLVDNPTSSRQAAAFQVAVIVFILASTSAAIVETVPEVRSSYAGTFVGIEATATLLFSVELVLRFLACDGPTAFFTNGFNIVDLLAVLPGLIFFWGHLNAVSSSAANAMMSLRTLRLIWLVRLFRLAKVARHSRLLSVCIAALTKIWSSSIIYILVCVLTLTVVSSSVLYLVEYDRCQSLGIRCTGFESIPHASWFAVVTLTTVGYGDVIPETAIGKAVAALLSVSAVMSLALAGALFSCDFAEHFREEKERRRFERELKLDGTRDQQFRELQELVVDVRRTSDALLAQLAASSARQRVGRSRRCLADADALDFDMANSQAPPLILKPMLTVIEERARIFSSEVQSSVFLMFEIAANKSGVLSECGDADFDSLVSNEEAS